MMKLVFLLLLLVNLVLFAWQQGAFGRFTEPGREPERIARQIEAERFRVLSEAEVQKLRERATQNKPAGIDLTVAQSCLEFGDFGPSDAARAEAALATLALGSRMSSRNVEVAGFYMVYLPPFKTRADVDRRADELRKLGVKELLVIGDNGPLRLAIGLGSFRDVDAAKSQLAALEKLGVKGARVSDKPSVVNATRFQLRDLDAAAAQQLATIRKEFPVQSIRPCTAAN
jgi:hypothetical protein